MGDEDDKGDKGDTVARSSKPGIWVIMLIGEFREIEGDKDNKDSK